MKNQIIILIIILILLGVGVLIFTSVKQNGIKKKETSKKSIAEKSIPDKDSIIKHSVPLKEIVSGGPPKDGIPSIDNPKFISIEEANKWLQDQEPGIAISVDGENRFYPFQILVWHEIVNDKINGKRILVTYCPLCLTGIVFDPLVKGERVEFGVSGKLWRSNLVMYDRKTDSLWSQILGEAIAGEMTGAKLKILPSDIIKYGVWKKKFPNGKVLSRDTGAKRFYGFNPYGSYFAVQDFSLQLVGFKDKRLEKDALVYGVVVNGKAKAYYLDKIKENREVIDEFENQKFLLKYDKELDIVKMYKILKNNKRQRINPVLSFWFAWVSAHPETELYK